MPILTPPQPLAHPVDWIPPGRHLVPVVDGLAACWVRIDKQPDNPASITVHTDGVWVPARPHIAAVAVERMVTNPVGPRQAYGRHTGFCGACGQPLYDPQVRQVGAHPDCITDRHTLTAATREEKQRARRHVVDALVEGWAAASHERRSRALVNAGPVIMEKLDIVTSRAENNQTTTGMPPDGHVITDPTDPRLPAWADSLAARITALANDQLIATALTWTCLDTIRHMTVDLTSPYPTRQLCTQVDSPADAERLLVSAAVQGRLLYAHLSCQPGLMLTMTVATA